MKTYFDQGLVEQIEQVHWELRPQLRTTPLVHSVLLSRLTGCEIYLKCEHLQHTGSFKYRGVSNKIHQLSDEQRQRGVVSASSGNHGLALAMVTSNAQIPCTLYVPETISDAKLAAISAFNIPIVMVAGDMLATELAAKAAAKAGKQCYISPYNDWQIIAGQGTCAMEMYEQENNLDAVFVSVGGGGLISGIGSVFKQFAPTTEIIGCWPEHAASMYHCLEQGYISEFSEQKTLSDGTAGGIEPDSITFPLCQKLIDRKVCVSEQEIKQAMRLLAVHERWMIEGAAGVALAAALRLSSEYQGKKIAVVLCGRNIALDDYLEAVSLSE